MTPDPEAPKKYGECKGPYQQPSVRKRIEALFLDNLGLVLTSDTIQEAARDPQTGRNPENWHQRFSELRTDFGYTILTNRDRPDLKPGEYLMLTAERRPTAASRVRPTTATWQQVLRRANNACEWDEGGACLLAEGAIDPVGGGTVRLTPDHRTPHSVDAASDPDDVDVWRALCGRHQVMKKNFWDDRTGKLNIIAILQAAPKADKLAALTFLTEYFDAR